MRKRLHELSDCVLNIFKILEKETKSFELASGIRCREACGECCLNPNIESSLTEMLPMARHLIQKNRADEVYERLSRDESSCVLYSPDPQDPAKGRCSEYDFRPSLCRLFGFSARKEKSGVKNLVSCHWHKKLQPEQVAMANERINADLEAPLMSDWIFRLKSLDASPADLRSLPINQALKLAIEKWKLSELEPEEPPVQPDLSRIPA